ncbi:MAG TPA: V-type ATPase subunit [Candidatus Wunengus sp. YC64]|uniref:V-type ATPase subunit n=1 Tax=Candidatus Wunengus sp. YC64 TaxID=3367700 RepID=UPI00402A214E
MENNVRRYEWCYVSGRINVLECNLLNQKFFEKLLSSDDFKDVLTNLNNTPLKAHFTHVKHLYEFETLLDEYYYNRLYEIRDLSPDTAVCDFFFLRNDVHNLKKFIKSKVFGTIVDKFFRGTIITDKLDDAWQDKSTALPEIFRESVSFSKKVIAQQNHNQTLPYPTVQKGEFSNSPLEKEGHGEFTVPSQGEKSAKHNQNTAHISPPLQGGTKAITPTVSPHLQGGDEGGVKNELMPFIIDLIFDGAYLRYIEDYCKRIEVEIIKRYLKTYQLVKGLEVIRRAISLGLDMNLLNQYFLEGFDQNHVFRKILNETTERTEKTLREIFAETYSGMSLPSLFSEVSKNISFRCEVVTDNYLLDILRPAKYTPFGPERVFGYLCGLTTEVFNLKLVLGGKVHRIENNLLRERLRNTYV